MSFGIDVKKIGDIYSIQKANSFTSGHSSTMGLATAYHLQHSSIRTQIFEIELHEIFTKTSVHLVRHSATGQLHFVRTHRKDRWLEAKHEDFQIHRKTPVEHLMYLNAQHLIDMSRKRLCNRAEKDTVKVMQSIKEAIQEIDPALAARMQPECVYRGGYCFEQNGSCGYMPRAGLNHYQTIIKKSIK